MDPTTFYKQHLDKYQLEEKRLGKLMLTYSMLRLFVFAVTGFGLYIFFSSWKLVVFIGLIGIVSFLYLLSKYTDLKKQKAFKKELAVINKEELDIELGNFYDRDSGLSFQDSNHFYSLDIDLFGRGSFFQCINRTTINEGTLKLAEYLKANNIHDIVSRQDAIKELCLKPQWRQYYIATSKLVEVETPANQIIGWLSEHKSFLPKKLMAWLPQVFSLLSLTILMLTYFNAITYQAIIGYWLVLGLGISGLYLKKINVLAANTSKVKDTFRQYAELLDLIENENFTSSLLVKKQKEIQAENEKASHVFKTFSKYLDALDNRNNLIGAIFGNGLFLTDLKNAYQIERWIESYHKKVADWFEVVSFFDAFNSLGNYAFNKPEFTYPKIIETGAVIDARDLGHPLLDKNKRIDSDLTINGEQFFIVTGANMAGKSTFLRTVSLHIVMANMGLPVCASSSIYKPIKLITSMRTSDSLADDSSYFFSELTRLKYIVDAIQKDTYFIVLDEILKGTNSKDKAIGSKKFVERLVASKATGIIATHDLSLCEIEAMLDVVKNYYFDAEIVNEELHFDYMLKTGICKNMNASFLLKKMNIV
ncbi:MutS-related protein [Cognatitamlana onchidii]|uniref:MutS-related protein n=1 Tax=Cognatitamlana onchidii TaxID=2562860 RepID=UPI0010A68B52|nr:DNA mismatch repair protein MutS [Algibacter onchidii]